MIAALALALALLISPPNACDLGLCEECPEPGGCLDTRSMLQCCGASGPGGCFEIDETTAECPPGWVVLYCEYGWCDADGSLHCIIP